MDRELMFGKALEEQLALVEEYLKNHKIGIGEPVNADDYLTKEEIRYLDIYLDELKRMEDVSEGEKEAISLSAMAEIGRAHV